MKFLIFLFMCASAQAAELSLGLTHFGHQPDGIWYQDPFAHELKMNSPSIGIGLAGNISDSMKWHAGYMYLGKTSSSALATASDADYAANGSHAKWPLSHWYGHGDVQGIYATIAPEKRLGNVTVSIEAGFTLFRPRWQVNIPDWRSCETCKSQSLTVTHNARLQLGVVIGIGLHFGNTELILSRWTAEASGDEWPAIYHGGATNLSLRTHF